MKKILLVDDDVELCSLLSDYLQMEGFTVEVVHNGQLALDAVAKQHFDVIVLDVMMPELNGFDTLNQLRSKDSTPVLMMTARGDEIDRIVGFEMGADDYLPKPCSPRELVARLRAIIRRIDMEKSAPDPQSQNSEKITHLDVELHLASRKARLKGEPLDLTQTEFRILQLLMEHPGEMISKDRLMDEVLNRKLGPFDRTIDMHMSNIRKKLGPLNLGPNNNEEPRIITIRGAGYQLVIPEQ